MKMYRIPSSNYIIYLTKQWEYPMKRLLKLSLLLSCIGFASLTSPQTVQALPFVDTGLKIGTGTGFATGDNNPLSEAEISNFAIGLAGSFDLVMVQLEINALYMNRKTENSVAGVSVSVDESFIAIPVIARLDISPIPMIKLAVGGGYERRFYQGDGESPELNYLPLSVRGDVKVPLVGSFGVEGRYNHQLGDDKNKVHEFMVFIHAFL